MLEYFTFLKHELKFSFPFGKRNEKKDILGNVLSILITLSIILVFIFFVSTLVDNYTSIKVNKIEAPYERASELLNCIYLISIIAIGLLSTEKMRKLLTDKKDKNIYLRLPVNPQTIFLSKFTVLLIWTYVLSFFVIMPINIIFYIVLKPTFVYWIKTLLVWIFLPMISFLIACVLIIPYIKVIDYLKEKYIIIFIGLSTILVCAFLVYTKFLGIIQQLLETGSIKFLFNESFTNGLQRLLIYAYPANSLTNIMLGDNLFISLLLVLLMFALSAVVAFIITKKLYCVTLYKIETEKQKKYKENNNKQLNPFISLVKKEFITISREPSYLFSYFAIATAMPIMVYCCYTLFESLIKSTVGLEITFALGILIILIFSVLTNTFCSTNITRDGLTNLKIKIIPVEPSKILLAKVVFCAFVSSVSVLLSSILLIAATSLSFWEGMFCALIGIIFSTTQVFIATRIDLNRAKISSSSSEVEAASSKIIAKVVFLGLIVALIIGILAVILTILSSGSNIDAIQKLNLKESYAYIITSVLCVLYFGAGFIFYNKNIKKSFDNLTL